MAFNSICKENTINGINELADMDQYSMLIAVHETKILSDIALSVINLRKPSS